MSASRSSSSSSARCSSRSRTPRPRRAARERITDYAVDIRIEPDGTLAVEEKIVYDFGSSPHHGIQRDLVRKERFDDDHDRRYDIDVTGVSASAGTPDDVAAVR